MGLTVLRVVRSRVDVGENKLDSRLVSRNLLLTASPHAEPMLQGPQYLDKVPRAYQGRFGVSLSRSGASELWQKSKGASLQGADEVYLPESCRQRVEAVE